MSNEPSSVTAATASQQARANNSRGGGVSTLLYACQQGDVDKVRRILRAQPNAHLERDRTGKTALHYCCTSDRIAAAQAADVLVMAASDLVENRDEDGFTPLHLAVIAGNMPLVTFLLANNADVNAVDNEKHTVVHWATVCGETVALQSVLSAGAPVSTPDVHGGYPLHYAAQMCGGEKDSTLGIQVLHTLLSHNDINVSVEDGDGRQPLLWAASAGSAKATLALIRAGATIESHDKDGLTALHCAASRGHTDCIDTLLTLCGASPDVIDSNGCTALHYAVTLGHADATALLLAHAADANRQDRKGRSPAHCGCSKGQFETLKMLGGHGANLWLRNARGDLPLHEAAASGRRDLVRWLLEARPSQVNARNNDGRCPLHLAALNGNADMCKILLDAGAQVNPVLRTSKNVFMTPLDCALQRGFRTTAKYLQLHGGVPANRLAGVPPVPNVGSAVSLQIRDDVTLWGDSSTESERENGDTKKKAKKKIYKRKFAYKYEKSKISESEKLSGSGDVLNTNEKQPSDFPFLANNIAPGEIFIYANEVNINEGKISDQKSARCEDVKSTAAQTTDSLKGSASSQSDKQEKRPKSAKYGRHKNKSSDQTKKPYVDTPDPRRKQHHTEESKHDDLQIAEDSLDKQQSARSNTSYEDDEAQSKQMVVEASVHSPPKEIPAQPIKENNVDATALPREERKTPIGSEMVTEAESKITAEDHAQNESTALVLNKVPSTIPLELNETATPIPKTALIDDTMEESPPKETSKQLQQPSLPNITVDPASSTSTSPLFDKQDSPTLIPSPQPSIDTTEEKSIVPASSSIKQEQPPIISESQKTETADESKLTNDNQEKQSPSRKRKQSSLDATNKPCNDMEVSNNQTKTSPNTAPKTPIESSEEDTSPSTSSQSSLVDATKKQHRSFKVLGEECKKKRSRSDEGKAVKILDQSGCKDRHERLRRSKIPTPIARMHSHLSKSDRHLERHDLTPSSIEPRVPSLPNIYDSRDLSNKHPRSVSNLSAPLISTHSDNESDVEQISSATRKKRLRKRSKTRIAKSAGSDYESSNLIDSGFEPSPRSTRIPKWKHMSEKSVNMTSVTQTIQSNIRRYHLERKIFQHLLDLKRLQIRSGQHNEAVLVKRAIDSYHRSCAATVGAGRYTSEDLSFKSFESFLYNSLRKIQKAGVEHLQGLPEAPRNPLHCTQRTHRCDHATHAYTGVPCAAYLPRMDHHTMPKIGFDCKPSGFLPKINNNNNNNTVTLELCHGSDKQVISLPAERLDQNKRYYVTFTVKGNENNNNGNANTEVNATDGHRHPKSD